ncbi:MAG: hypothetical protein AAGN82_22360 [Myxococcota bacterium]
MPRVIRKWDERQGVLPGYAPRTRYREGLLYTGAWMFGASYVVTAVVAAGSSVGDGAEPVAQAPLFIPVLGPFIRIEVDDEVGPEIGALVWSSVLQATGFGLLLGGIFATKTVLVRTYPVREISLTPWVSPRVGGVGLKGRF